MSVADISPSTPSLVASSSTTTMAPLPYTSEEFMSEKFTGEHMAKIVQEGIILGGGAAAILLQVANPGVAAGVNEHSNFSYRVADRLRTTMTFIFCMSLGTPEEKKALHDMITSVHQSIKGTVSEGRDKGKVYAALDPKLQLWVAATLYASAVPVYERVFGQIEDEEFHEKVYQEYGVLACSLQVPAEMWPRTRRDFWVYWDNEVAGLEITQNAREVARDVLELKHAPWYLRMALPGLRLATTEFLPERIREGYGLTARPKSYKALETTLRVVYPRLPISLRRYPSRHYLEDMRRRLLAGKGVIDKAS
ncbi:hypothetical protein BX600DRAFT_516819 [Xylariales sp. PMI_506]|nr:hypothetical protein BX600DRAFT_516819 [Xylariales sp. PMI_506]